MTTTPEKHSSSITPRSGLPTAFDPFTRLRDEMDGLIGRYFHPAPALSSGTNGDMLVAFDVAETDKAYEFKLDVPGVNRDDIDIAFEQGRLTVSGERQHEATEEKKAFRRTERSFGAFSSSFALPADVNGDKIEAQLKDGVLTITVPKSDDARKRVKKIAVKAS